MNDYDIALNFEAEIIWLEPPENRAEQFRRDHLNLVAQREIKEFEMQLTQHIRENWATNQSNSDS